MRFSYNSYVIFYPFRLLYQPKKVCLIFANLANTLLIFLKSNCDVSGKDKVLIKLEQWRSQKRLKLFAKIFKTA